MASTNQEDGCYPRLNATMLQSGQHVNMIASLIGTVESCDGQIAAIKCGDGQTARVAVDPTFVFPPGKTIECIGAVTENGELQLFVTREMSSDFDMEIYNKMITDVQQNPKFSEYFVSPAH
jgi:hypothetical protein